MACSYKYFINNEFCLQINISRMFCISVSLQYLQLNIFIKVSVQIQQYCLFIIKKASERFSVLGRHHFLPRSCFTRYTACYLLVTEEQRAALALGAFALSEGQHVAILAKSSPENQLLRPGRSHFSGSALASFCSSLPRCPPAEEGAGVPRKPISPLIRVGRGRIHSCIFNVSRSSTSKPNGPNIKLAGRILPSPSPLLRHVGC